MRVIVIHGARATTRQTTIDHLLSFRQHLPEDDVQYLHFQQPIPRDLEDVRSDLLVINYDYLNYRFSPLWPYIKNRHINLARNAGKVVAVAQDDFWANVLLDNWCMDWGVDRILTPIEHGLEILYPRSSKAKEFRTALTGYVPTGAVPRTPPLRERPINLGQRVRAMSPHLGRLALLKSEQALAFSESAERSGFVVDVSARVEDSFIGNDWFEFLASCQFTVGTKGGASLYDRYGLTYLKVQSYLQRYPNASFDEVEKHCFLGRDMKHVFTAVSPRLFEAARARTCQILTRDDYLGVLEPWQHYIPLETDMRNLDEVFQAMRDVERCQEIVDHCHRALIDSGDFDYSKFVALATEGVSTTDKGPDENWEQFCDHLRSSCQIFEEFGPEFHDAVVAYLTQHSLNRSKFRRGTAFGRRTSNLAIARIEELIHLRLDHEWIMRHLDLYRSDKVVARSPWVWRPV